MYRNDEATYMLDLLRDAIVNCEVVPIRDKDGRVLYYYAVFPTNGIPCLDSELLREIGCEMVRRLDLENVDRIVVPEAMGIHLGTVLSLMTDIPLNIVRKRRFGLEGEREIVQKTDHKEGETKLYINGLTPGMRVVVVDDVISSGGTMRAILNELRDRGVEVVDVCAVIKRADPDIGRDYTYLVEVEVTDGGTVTILGLG